MQGVESYVYLYLIFKWFIIFTYVIDVVSLILLRLQKLFSYFLFN